MYIYIYIYTHTHTLDYAQTLYSSYAQHTYNVVRGQKGAKHATHRMRNTWRRVPLSVGALAESRQGLGFRV